MTRLLLLSLVMLASKLEQGQKLFASGQFAEALKILDAAAAEGGDAATLEKVHLLRGQAFAARQDFARAEEAFAQALDANPEAQLDPSRVDPSVVKLLDAIRGRLTGTLTVSSTPSGANVSIDGKEIGAAAATTQSLSIGRHKLQARWGEEKPEELDVVIRTRRETVVHLVLHETKVIEKQIVEVPAKCPPCVEPAPVVATHRFGPYLDARVTADLNAGPEGGIDLGGGLEIPVIYMRVGASVRLYRYFHVLPRIAFVVPFSAQLSAFLELEVGIRPDPYGISIGGAAGVEYKIFQTVGVFAQLGGRHFVAGNETFVVDSRLTVSVGARAHLF
jgi:hypothetical protein